MSIGPKLLNMSRFLFVAKATETHLLEVVVIG
jgi:hypothetical protein